MLSNIFAFLVFPVGVLLAFCHKYDSSESFEEEYFSKKQTTILKGIMSIVVFLHHFQMIVDNVEWIERAYRGVQYSVGVFFFLAGYTSFLGYMKAGKVNLKKAWINRCWRLYLPLTIMTVWLDNFLAPLLIFFVFTDFAFIIFKNNKARLTFIFFGNWLFIALFIIFARDLVWWYDDVLTYSLGALFALNKDRVISYLRENKVRYWMCFLGLLAVYVAARYNAYIWRYYTISTMLSSTVGALLMFLVLMKVRLESRVFYFLGQYTFEFYYIQNHFLCGFNKIFSHNSVVLLASFACAILLSVLVQWATKKLRNKVTS